MTSLNLAEQAVQHFRYWLEEGAEALEEALEIFEAERSNADDERRQRQDSQREYQSQSRRLHDMLRDERHRRWEQESQLRDERNPGLSAKSSCAVSTAIMSSRRGRRQRTAAHRMIPR
jgi:hypothetical protein